VLAQHVADRRQRETAGRLVAAGERQLELELVEAIGTPHVAQAGAAQQRAERGLDRRTQARDDRRRGTDIDMPPRLRGRDLRGELCIEIRRREVAAFEHAVHERPHVHADRHLGQQ
jgi:hypothetical protein